MNTDDAAMSRQKYNMDLTARARQTRIDILKMIYSAGSGHIGGSFSCVEILIYLYFYQMRHEPTAPRWPTRDRFILSKGHAAPALYSVLCRSGYFDFTKFVTFRKPGSALAGHPLNILPGIEMSAGPIGQGLSFANGVAQAGKLDGIDYKVYILVGDGEIQEGQIYEAAIMSAHLKLDNIILFIDRNGLQLDGRTEDIKRIRSIKDLFFSLGWDVLTRNGHDFSALLSCSEDIEHMTRPLCIICDTIKGKGIDCIENNTISHSFKINDENFYKFINEIAEENGE